jgi:hypothetical protein
MPLLTELARFSSPCSINMALLRSLGGSFQPWFCGASFFLNVSLMALINRSARSSSALAQPLNLIHLLSVRSHSFSIRRC